MVALLRRNRVARLFLLAHGQSSVGTAAAYVALLALAYEREPVTWAVTLVLIADFLPGALLGPLAGAAADRWSRRWVLVGADLLRAGSMVAIVLWSSYPGMVALALLVGLGTTAFRPSAKAALPTLARGDDLTPLVAAHAMLDDVGVLLGPAVAAGLLLAGGPETVLMVNAGSFVISAAILLRLPLDVPRERNRAGAGVLAEALAGMRALGRLPGVRVIVLASLGALVGGAMSNVGEVLLAEETLDVGSAGFAVLVFAFGAGAVTGSARGARPGGLADYKRRYLAGLAVTSLGLAFTALVLNLPMACAALALTGFGTSLLVVHENQLLQRVVPEELLGRIFGCKDALESIAFMASFAAGGVLANAGGARLVFAVSAAALGVTGVAASAALRHRWTVTEEEGSPRPANALARSASSA